MNQGLALLRKKEEGDWTEQHRNVARKIFLEGGWTQKQNIRHRLVGHQSVSSLSDGGRHRKAQALPLSGMARSEARHSGSLQEMGAKCENIKDRMEMAKRYSRTPTQWKPVEQRKFQNEDVGVRKAPKLVVQVEGFKGHVATDGSL